MGQTVREFDPNDRKYHTRTTVDSSDISKATSSSDPRVAGSVLGPAKPEDVAGRPKREDYKPDLVGQAQFTKAEREWRKAQAQAKALSGQ